MSFACFLQTERERRGQKELLGARAVEAEVGAGPRRLPPHAACSHARGCTHARLLTLLHTRLPPRAQPHTRLPARTARASRAPWEDADPLAPPELGQTGSPSEPCPREQLKAPRDPPPQPGAGRRRCPKAGQADLPRMRTSLPPGARSWAGSRDWPLPSRPSQSRGPGLHGEQLCGGAVGGGGL